MRLLICSTLALSLVAIAVTAADQPKARKKNRTAPLGYEDTPKLPDQPWRVHDLKRPRPRMVNPGTPSTLQKPGIPPADAVVLFDGKDLSKWDGVLKGKIVAPPCIVKNGYMEIPSDDVTLQTKEKFGDAQIHIEWMAPPVIDGTSQWRGNSGILIMGRYEIQVLDSYDNPTYADGQAGSIYGQWPPLVNASRKPGEWQMYDIIFDAPRFENGKLAKPAFVTVLHNGVVLHHRKEIIAPMAHRIVKPYEPHNPEEPFALQNHDTAVRYRNIWIRRLTGYDEGQR